MIRHIEKCPNCGNNVEGQPQIDITRQLARKGTSFGANKVFKYILGSFIAPVLGTIVFPAVGTFIGFIICFILVYQAQKYADKISVQVDRQLFQHVDYSFTCPSCGRQWAKTFQTGLSDMPDDVLEALKTEKVNNTKGYSQIFGVIGLITIALFAYGLYYCITKDARYATGETYSTWFGTFDKYEVNYWWYAWGLAVVFNFFISLLVVPIWLKYLCDYFALKSMSLQDFMRKYFH